MIVTLILLFVLITAFYLLYFKPIQAIKRYEQEFTKRGYKVLVLPYNPFDIPAIRALYIDKTGDPFSVYKSKYISYDILVGNYLTKPMLIFLSPQVRKQLSKHEIDYCYVKIPNMVNLFGDVIGRGLGFTEGDDWKRKRRLLSKFFTFDYLQKLIPDISKISENCLTQIQLESVKEKGGAEAKQYDFLLFKLTVRVFSSVILSMFLGAESLDEKINGENVCYFMVNLVAESSIQINNPLVHMLGPKFLKMGLRKMDRKINQKKRDFNQWVNAYTDNLIEKAKLKSEPTNLIELLLLATNKQERYSKHEVIQQLKMFFFAGSDTTSHLTEMMIYYSALSPTITQKVRQEIKSIKNISSSENLKKAVFIQSILKETIRYYGPLPMNFLRISTKRHSFDGVTVNPGTCVYFNAVCTHFSQEYFSKPYEFRPQRWSQQCKSIDNACLIGFGMGPRTCIGQYLAYMEAKILFFQFFKRYNKIKVPQKTHLVWRFMNETDNLFVSVKAQE